jgi:hypothetical protein
VFCLKKKPEEQRAPESCIREIAEELNRDKWHVKADLPGFEKPGKIGEFQPTLEATKKGCMRRICEVFTDEMFEGDKERYLEVKNYCDEYDFHMYVVGKNGKYKEIDPETFGKK